MIPKEKAAEMIANLMKEKIVEYTPYAGGNTEFYSLNLRETKYCVKFTCNEIIKALPKTELLEDTGKRIKNREIIYWEEVLTELENF